MSKFKEQSRYFGKLFPELTDVLFPGKMLIKKNTQYFNMHNTCNNLLPNLRIIKPGILFLDE